MQNVLSTNKARLSAWRVIAGHVITVARSSLGAGRRRFVTVSPCGLIRNPGFGRSPYRAGFLHARRATRFSLLAGTIYVKHYSGRSLTLPMLPLWRASLNATSCLTFILLPFNQPQDGSRTWLCTQVLVIKRTSRR